MKLEESVRKVDSYQKASGKLKYVGDLDQEEYLHGVFIRSEHPRANIISIHYPSFPEGYYGVDARDIPGKNQVHIVLDDMPIFTEKELKYPGDPICMIVGRDLNTVKKLAKDTVVELEILEPVLDYDKSTEYHFEYAYQKGDLNKAFEEADEIYEEEFRTGLQEQCYLETQGMIAEYQEDGTMLVRGSLQCPYYIVGAIKTALNLDQDHVRIIQDPTGGAFGGKEDYPSILAAQVAVAAYKGKSKVRVVFDREQDILATSKKHPSHSTYRVAIRDGKITGMKINVRYDGGAYTTLSSVVLQRGIICSSGVYTFDNLDVSGEIAVTNTVPNGAFRGFGAPQVFFSIEMLMNHIADHLGKDRLEFKKEHLSKKGDITSTSGKVHFDVPLPEMIDDVVNRSQYYQKKEEYKKDQGRYRRGIEIAMYYHGAGFTGSGERDIIKAVAGIKKHKDGQIEILAANTDMGQGVFTTFRKIIAEELQMDYKDVLYNYPDTKFASDSGPTVASRSIMIVGELIRRAARDLKENWIDGEEQIFEQRFKEPDFQIPFDISTFQGDAYPINSYACVAVDLKVDTYTGEHILQNVYGSFDVGTPIDMNIVLGQLEGGVVQGIGHSSMEAMYRSKSGHIRETNLSDYLIPTAKDIPMLQIKTHLDEYCEGPFGAKGCGELPVVGVAPAYVGALENCVGQLIHHIPVTIDQTFEYLEVGNEN